MEHVPKRKLHEVSNSLVPEDDFAVQRPDPQEACSGSARPGDSDPGTSGEFTGGPRTPMSFRSSPSTTPMTSMSSPSFNDASRLDSKRRRLNESPSNLRDVNDAEAGDEIPQDDEDRPPLKDITASVLSLQTGVSEIRTSLCDLLDNAMVSRPGPLRIETQFMPKGALEHLVTVKAIEQELASLQSNVDDQRRRLEAAERICGKSRCSSRTYRKIFAMLVRMNKVESITSFLDQEVSDEDMPFREYSPPQTQESSMSSPIRLCRNHDTSKPLEVFDKSNGWRQSEVTTFFNQQWCMMAPVFSLGETSDEIRLDSRQKLPFIYDARDHAEDDSNGEYTLVESSRFSEVFQVRIHPDHYHLERESSKNHKFAVKVLSSKDHKEWKPEIEMLKRFRSDKDPHLISLLGTYIQSRSLHLIFHWADADLEKYWKKVTPKPEMDENTVEWVTQQCLGIAMGIAAIHRQATNPLAESPTLGHGSNSGNAPWQQPPRRIYGRHGDIKPRNILWFKNKSEPAPGRMGRLVVTDFGSSETNTRDSRSNKDNLETLTQTYCAPESYVPGIKITRSYDIWSLGCLYLEFITWLLGGSEYLEDFVQRRCKFETAISIEIDWFFQLEYYGDTVTGARLKDEVVEFIAELDQHPRCTSFIQDFLKLIQRELLVVESTPRRGSHGTGGFRGQVCATEPNRRRFTIQQVVAKLNETMETLKANMKTYGLDPHLSRTPGRKCSGNGRVRQFNGRR